jgi:hypothetical protein
MQGNKTHAQHLRTLEQKPDLGTARRKEAVSQPDAQNPNRHGGSAMQENRDHNKHNHGGQEGHKSQKHGRAEEKH